MLIKLIFVSIVLVALVIAALGVKLIFDKKAEFRSYCGGSDCVCENDQVKSCDH